MEVIMDSEAQFQHLLSQELHHVQTWMARINDNRREYAGLFNDGMFIANRKLIIRLLTCYGQIGMAIAWVLMVVQMNTMIEVAVKQREREIGD